MHYDVTWSLFLFSQLCSCILFCEYSTVIFEIKQHSVMVFIRDLRTLDRIFKKILQTHWDSWCGSRSIFFTIYFSNRRDLLGGTLRVIFLTLLKVSMLSSFMLCCWGSLSLPFRVGLHFTSQHVCPRLFYVSMANIVEEKSILITLVSMILSEVPWRDIVRTVIANQGSEVSA